MPPCYGFSNCLLTWLTDLVVKDHHISHDTFISQLLVSINHIKHWHLAINYVVHDSSYQEIRVFSARRYLSCPFCTWFRQTILLLMSYSWTFSADVLSPLHVASAFPRDQASSWEGRIITREKNEEKLKISPTWGLQVVRCQCWHNVVPRNLRTCLNYNEGKLS